MAQRSYGLRAGPHRGPGKAKRHIQLDIWCNLPGPGVAALVLPRCDTRGMQWHPEDISSQVEPGAHALIIPDQAGGHTTSNLDSPENMTLLPLPPRSLEPDPVENVWQYLRQNWLSNRIVQSQMVSLCCDAWNNLTERPWKIMSIGYRK